MTRVPVNPKIVRWARERAGRKQAELTAKFRKLPEWETGEVRPTLRQVEAFARTVHVPVGYLFLTEPPDEPVPIPDFRTLGRRPVARPSPNLLDTIYACQERQSWYRDFARAARHPALDFVGSVTIETPPEVVAVRICVTLGLDLSARQECPTWADALRQFIRQADSAGVLVMVDGVVTPDNRRRLDPAEFCGFALCDPLAPLIFMNGADAEAAQMFTLAHELARLWLGESALSNFSLAPEARIRREEAWCNAVAAELLVPLAMLQSDPREGAHLPTALSRLARVFKVSTLVILRRLLDAHRIGRRRFDAAWEQEVKRLRDLEQGGSGGGGFYRTTFTRVGYRFARALVVSALEGQTLYRDAFRMLGVSRTRTFNDLRHEVGIPE